MGKQVGYNVEINLKFHREVWFDEDENPTEEDAIDYVVGNLFEGERGSWQHNVSKWLRENAEAERIED